MRRLATVLMPALCACLICCAAPAAQWQTADGLDVRLSDRTGQFERLSVDDHALKLDGGGGLSFREFTRAEGPPRVVLQVNAEGERPNWSQASFADWEAQGDFVRRVTGQAPEGEAYLALGNGKDAGVGMAAVGTMPVSGGDDCTISWWARTHNTDLTFILCMRVFDQKGRDITESVPAPPGWTWTPYSKAHYRCDLSNTKPDTWERLSCDYSAGAEVATAQLSLRVYTKGDLRADIDDLQVSVKAGHWSNEVAVTGRLERTAEGFRQHATVGKTGLVFDTLYAQEAGRLHATVAVTDTTARPRGRCLCVRYRVPLALTGWTWSAAPNRAAIIAADERYEDDFGLAGHRLSRYPLASVSRDKVGLAMAVPLDQPALQSFSTGADGLGTIVDLGLSPHAPRAHARFTFSLYRHDPAWTFRAALERYYALFPALFAPASDRGGAWTLRIPKPEDAAPEDFGLVFYECSRVHESKAEYCHAHGVLMFPYSEPWGQRQNLGQAESSSQLPPYEERLAFLKSLAESTEEGKKWGAAPRAEMAQAVLNSMLLGPDGLGAFLVDYYSSWAQWWQLNTDPDLPEPSIASVCRKYEIDPVLGWADGIYLDSVSPWFMRFEDHNPTHLAAADLPLAFSPRTGTPVVLSGFSAYEFIAKLYVDLHRQGKLLMMNLFPPATRLVGHFGDVVGSELLGLQDDDEALQQRVYAYRRPVSNLMQWKSAVRVRVPAMTPDEMESYAANQLLYGFWPGISTAGGGTEPGYAHMHRYFEDADLLARDRALFAKYLPVFDALNRAGWEPVTHVRSDVPEVRVERFGGGRAVMLAVGNNADEAKQATLTFDRGWWEHALGAKADLAFRSDLTNETIRAERDGNALTCRVTIPARRTLVLRVNEG